MTDEIEIGKFKVGKLGWENENVLPIILIRKADRDNLKLEDGTLVKCKHGSNTTTAVVCKQFKELVPLARIATVSTKLGQLLDCIEGDEVEIVEAVNDPATMQQFARQAMAARFSHVIAAVNQMAARDAGGNPADPDYNSADHGENSADGPRV